ncbi:MAG: aminopeptidase P N-terminal domain-containing protein [Bacteroidota bacterium]
MAVFRLPYPAVSPTDVEYLYHASPDMYYFSGYKEPHSLLLIFKNEQTDSAGNTYSEVLFVQKRNAQAEQWTGKRLGAEGAKEKLGIPMSLNGEDFKISILILQNSIRLYLTGYLRMYPMTPGTNPTCLT